MLWNYIGHILWYVFWVALHAHSEEFIPKLFRLVSYDDMTTGLIAYRTLRERCAHWGGSS